MKMYKLVILAAIGLASVPAVKAESYGDLIVGFTTQTGTDHLYDLGNLASLTIGQTRTASALGLTSGAYTFGVIGDAYAADYTSNGGFLTTLSGSFDTLWATTSGATPVVANKSVFGAADTGITSILNQFPGKSANTNPGDNTSIAASDDNSWATQTINGTKTSNFVNAYGNPNAVNQGAAILWQVADDGVSAPVAVGQFNLDSSGNLSFNSVPEPSTYGLLLGAGVALLAFRKSTVRKTA